MYLQQEILVARTDELTSKVAQLTQVLRSVSGAPPGAQTGQSKLARDAHARGSSAFTVIKGGQNSASQKAPAAAVEF